MQETLTSFDNSVIYYYSVGTFSYSFFFMLLFYFENMTRNWNKFLQRYTKFSFEFIAIIRAYRIENKKNMHFPASTSSFDTKYASTNL